MSICTLVFWLPRLVLGGGGSTTANSPLAYVCLATLAHGEKGGEHGIKGGLHGIKGAHDMHARELSGQQAYIAEYAKATQRDALATDSAHGVKRKMQKAFEESSKQYMDFSLADQAYYTRQSVFMQRLKQEQTEERLEDNRCGEGGLIGGQGGSLAEHRRREGW